MALIGRTYEEVCSNFSWHIPARFNIANAICDRYVGGGRAALIFETDRDTTAELTFEQLHEHSRRLANALSARWNRRGRSARHSAAAMSGAVVAHLAAYRLGAIALPLFTLFGPDAIEYGLNDSGTKAVVSDAGGRRKAARRRRQAECASRF